MKPRARIGLGWLVLLGWVLPLWAVDPLPLSMEGASEEAQARYLAEQARESYEQKLVVGRERHLQRVRAREAVHEQMAVEAANRQTRLAGTSASLGPGLRGGMLFKSTAVMAAALIGFMVLFRVSRLGSTEIE